MVSFLLRPTYVGQAMQNNKIDRNSMHFTLLADVVSISREIENKSKYILILQLLKKR